MRIPIPERLRVLVVLPLVVATLGLGAAVGGQQEAVPAEGSPLLDSPRGVMEAFLEGMVAFERRGEDRDRERAVGALDFEGLDEAMGRKAATLVRDLHEALDRVEYIDLSKLPGPGDPALADGTHTHSFGPPPSDPGARIDIRFVRGSDGGWRIAAETVAEIDAIWQGVEDLPPIAELPLLTRIQHALRGSLPRPLLGKVFVLATWQWIALALLLFLAVVVDRILRGVTRTVLRRLARRGRVSLAEDTLLDFGRPVGFLTAAVVFGFFLPVLDLEPQILRPLSLAASFAATVAGVWAAYRLVDVGCGYLAQKAEETKSKFDDVLVPLLRRTLRIFVVLVGLVFLASRWTEDLWSVVAGLGVGSIAVAFAGRDTIENLFGTFTVLLDKPFELGDWILVGDLEGTVEEVGFRSTRIRTFYNSLISVPNRTFVTANVDNMGRRRYRRITTTLGLTYDTPPEKIEAFCEGTRQILRNHPYTRKDYYHVYLNGFGASSLDVMLYCFVETPDWATELREKHRLFADILRLADELGVGFAFPTQTIHLAKPEGLEHQDRPASDTEGAQIGRCVADRVTAQSLEPWGGPGSIPPPVVSPSDPRDRRGSEDDDGE